jgi:predicted small secreted protein
MEKTMKTVLVVPALMIVLTLCLSACNTVEGLGQDIKKGGEVITGTASDTKRKM